MKIKFYVNAREYVYDRYQVEYNPFSNSNTLISFLLKSIACCNTKTGEIKISLPKILELENKNIDKCINRLYDVIFHESLHSVLINEPIDVQREHYAILQLSYHLGLRHDYERLKQLLKEMGINDK